MQKIKNIRAATKTFIWAAIGTAMIYASNVHQQYLETISRHDAYEDVASKSSHLRYINNALEGFSEQDIAYKIYNLGIYFALKQKQHELESRTDDPSIIRYPKTIDRCLI